MLGICGFVVCFSVVTGFLESAGVFSAASSALSGLFAVQPDFVRTLLTGFLELGGGIAALRSLSPSPVNLALASFLLGFGGLSVHCQTLAAVADAQIATGRHFFGRLLHGLLSALFTLFLAAAN